MTRSDGIRIVTEWEAERILLDRGFTKVKCLACDGARVIPIKPADDSLFEGARVWTFCCHACEGAGWKWQAPLVR